MNLLEEVQFLEKFKKREVAKRGLRDLYYFNREILERDNPDRQKFIVPHVHGEWWKWYKSCKQTTRLLLVPRNSLKSTFFTVGFTLQQIAKNPNVRILIANAKLDNAVKFLSEIKSNIKNNESYIENYGEMFDTDAKWTETEIEVVGRRAGTREPTVMAIGAGAGLAGLHFDFIISDDLMNEVTSATREQAQKIIEWWQRSESLLDPQTGISIVIGTRWAHYDLYQHILDELTPQTDIYIRTAYNDDGTAYYPEMLSLKTLDRIRIKQGSTWFSRFYLNSPVDKDTVIIGHDKIHYYDRECPCGEYHKKPKNSELAIFTTCDPASAKTVTSDYTAIVTVGIDNDGNWYVLEAVRGRWSVFEMVERLFDTQDRFQPQGMSIEVIGQAQTMLQNIRDAETLKGRYLPIVPIKSRGATKKAERIRATLQARFEQTSVFLGKGMEALEDELSSYPRSKHDDLIDALSDIAEIGYTPDKEVEKEKEPVTIQERIWANLTETPRPFVDDVLGEEF